LDRCQISTFDAYAENLQRANIQVILTAPQRNGWSMARCPVGRVILEFCSEGSANITVGFSRLDVIEFRLPAAASRDLVRVNGRPVGQDEMVIIPPGTDFIFTSSGPHKWFSVLLAVNADHQSATRFSEDVIAPLGKRVSVVTTMPGLLARIERIATDMERNANSVLYPEVARSADYREQFLIDMLFSAVAARTDEWPRSATRSWLTSEKIVHRALERIQAHDKTIHVEDLCLAIGATSRSLRRAFHTFFGLGPSNFLKLQQLNRIRRELLAQSEPGMTITSVLASHNVMEFGRFAGEYRTLFGELPSQTLRKPVEGTGEQLAQRET
jgi:AraC-like DNA-binding protein